MDLQIIMLSKPKKDRIAYMRNLKKKKKLEINLNTRKTLTHRRRKQIQDLFSPLFYQRGKGERDRVGIWDQQIQTTMYKADKQGLIVQHRELCPISCNEV